MRECGGAQSVPAVDGAQLAVAEMVKRGVYPVAMVPAVLILLAAAPIESQIAAPAGDCVRCSGARCRQRRNHPRGPGWWRGAVPKHILRTGADRPRRTGDRRVPTSDQPGFQPKSAKRAEAWNVGHRFVDRDCSRPAPAPVWAAELPSCRRSVRVNRAARSGSSEPNGHCARHW